MKRKRTRYSKLINGKEFPRAKAAAIKAEKLNLPYGNEIRNALRLAEKGSLAIKYQFKDVDGTAMPKEVNLFLHELYKEISEAAYRAGAGTIAVSTGIALEPYSGSKALLQMHIDIGMQEDESDAIRH